MVPVSTGKESCQTAMRPYMSTCADQPEGTMYPRATRYSNLSKFPGEKKEWRGKREQLKRETVREGQGTGLLSLRQTLILKIYNLSKE